MDDKSINPQQSKKGEKDSRKTIVVVVITILLAVNGLLLWQFFTKKRSLERVSVNLETAISEKESLSAELDKIKSDLDKVRAENESLKSELSAKDAEIQSKVEEIERLLRSGDPAKLRQARNELRKLKELNQTYLAQIDSLRTENVQLSAQNTDLSQSLETEKGRVRSLTEENTLLANKVAIGAALKATYMESKGVKYKSSGREVETKKASGVDKIRTCCTVLQNLVAEPGLKYAYLRVLSPDGAVMSTSSETFLYNNQATLYTLKEPFQYENQDTQLCLYWSKGSQYSKGEYTIEIYCEGNLIGSTRLSLK